MLRRQLLASAVLACPAAGVFAQEKFPSRAIEFIVPWGAGGGSDQTARTLAQLLETELKTPVTVLNIPGATGSIGVQKMLASPADGYRMALLAWDSFATLATQPPGWGLDDIVPLAIVIQLPSGLYVAADKYPNWKAVEEAARQRPLSVAISGMGSPDDITIGYFATKGIRFTPVPFARPGERYSALIGGHVDMLYSPTGNVVSFVEGKKMRPVLLLAGDRAPDYPDTPTSKELGYDITLPQRRAVIVKAGTEPARIKVLQDAIAKVAASDKYKAYLKESNAWADSFVMGPESLKLMQRDMDDMKKILAATKK